jgi:hypothetical protein
MKPADGPPARKFSVSFIGASACARTAGAARAMAPAPRMIPRRLIVMVVSSDFARDDVRVVALSFGIVIWRAARA